MLDWPAELDRFDAEHDAALADDDTYPAPLPTPFVPRYREDSPAMKRALAEVAATGRASRYARLCVGGCWMADPMLHRRIYRWVLHQLNGERI